MSKKFEKIVVEYSSLYIYPEYKGKPYFGIQYEENGEHFIGYGTYNSDILSQYLREFFMDGETTEGEWTNDKCSICGKGIEDLISSREWYANARLNYCPFCGAKMKEVEDGD